MNGQHDVEVSHCCVFGYQIMYMIDCMNSPMKLVPIPFPRAIYLHFACMNGPIARDRRGQGLLLKQEQALLDLPPKIVPERLRPHLPVQGRGCESLHAGTSVVGVDREGARSWSEFGIEYLSHWSHKNPRCDPVRTLEHRNSAGLIDEHKLSG